MASSASSKRSKRRTADLEAQVAARLQQGVEPGERVLLALSGGVDSIVLLDLLARLSGPMGYALGALHVNHQLSPNARSWAQFCRAACAGYGVPCRVATVKVERGNSTEGAAREARYGAFRRASAEVIALAHNADDQAETVLLQILRGAGVRGAAAMPMQRGRFVRPLLDAPRADIERYARVRGLEWIEDESNADTSYLRNWLRAEILPRVAQRVPAYRSVLGRAAAHFGEAAELLDELAGIDAGGAAESGRIDVSALRALSAARARNVLRYMIGRRGWPMPDADRLHEALRQALEARDDARVAVVLGPCELRRHRGVVHLVPRRPERPIELEVTWRGERTLHLPRLGGVLTMAPSRGAGLSLARLKARPVTVRLRKPGERLQPDVNRPTRTVKNLMQEALVPTWERDYLPFIYSGDTLVCVPGVAEDHRYRAATGEASIDPRWRAG